MIALLLANWRTVLIALLAAALAGVSALYRHEVAAFGDYRITVDAERKAAAAEKERIEQHNEEVTKDVSNAWNAQIPALQKAAVDRYRHRFVDGRPVCSAPVGMRDVPATSGAAEADHSEDAGNAEPERVDAGQCEPPAEFIRSCAEDAFARRLTREWAERVGIESE